MKVAYLLVTTAWLVGAQPGAAQDAAKQPAAAPAVAVAPVTVYGSSCGCNTGCSSCGCNTCDSGCGCGGFLQRCRDFCGRLFSVQFLQHLQHLLQLSACLPNQLLPDDFLLRRS